MAQITILRKYDYHSSVSLDTQAGRAEVVSWWMAKWHRGELGPGTPETGGKPTPRRAGPRRTLVGSVLSKPTYLEDLIEVVLPLEALWLGLASRTGTRRFSSIRRCFLVP